MGNCAQYIVFSDSIFLHEKTTVVSLYPFIIIRNMVNRRIYSSMDVEIGKRSWKKPSEEDKARKSEKKKN